MNKEREKEIELAGIASNELFPDDEMAREAFLEGVKWKSENEKTIMDEALSHANAKYLRLYAEYENYRKRTTKEKSDILESAGASVIKSILPTLDNFERAIKSFDDEGVKIIYNSLLKNLKSKGLETMDVIGKDFTPELHEAITQMAVDGMKGKVVDVMENGYLLNGKVIRFAKVVVGI